MKGKWQRLVSVLLVFLLLGSTLTPFQVSAENTGISLETIKYTSIDVTTEPEKLIAGQDFKIIVNGTYDVYDETDHLKQSNVKKQLAGLVVEFNQETYTTNTEGIIEIIGEKAQFGEYELRILEDQDNSFQGLLPQSKKMIVAEEPDTTTVATVNVRVEGSGETLVDIQDFEVKGKEPVSIFEATVQALEANDIAYESVDSGFGPYIESIGGDKASQFNKWDGWLYTLNDSSLGEGAGSVTAKDDDTIVWYYGNTDSLYENNNAAGSVEDLTLRPIITVNDEWMAGKEAQIQISAEYNSYDSSYQLIESDVIANIENATVLYNGKEYKTNADGIATVSAEDVVAGKFELKVTKDVEGSFPRLLRSYKTITIDEPAQVVDYKAETAKSVTKTVDYYKNVGLKANTSYSNYWTLSGLWAAGVDLSTFPWAEDGSPFAVDTFWQKGLSEANNASNADAGAIIGSVLLGKDPTAFGTQNLVEDLKAKQKENGSFSTIWGEPWAMIALDLIDESYNQEKHIQTMLAAQAEETGYFGDTDSTGWVLWALSAHKDNEDVKVAIEKAVAGIHKNFQASQGEVVKNNSNSNAALISGLAAVGEDLFSEKWTLKTENGSINIIKYFIDMYQLDDGGFKWKSTDTKVNGMATQQALLAIADAVEGSSVFARLKDASLTEKPNPGEGETGDNTDNEEDQPSTGGGSSGGSSGGSATNPNKETVKISITVSSSEVPLAPTDIEYKENDTVFDVLKRATEKNDIELNYRNTSYGIYVAGIAGINEFDQGPLSGWTYKVNAELPEVSADNYETKAGDTIEWIYTADSENEDSSSGGGSGGSGGSGGNSDDDLTANPEENANTDETTKPEENTGNGETIKPEENGNKNETATPVPFKDVPNNWSKPYIEKAIELNLFKGYKDGTFRPQEQLTRAQAAAVVVRALNLSTAEQAPFEDIKNLGKVTQTEIAAAYKYGIVLGQLDGSFNPSAKVTRAQLALMLSRAYAYKVGQAYEVKGIAPFNDYGNANEATVDAITTMYELGIASGSNGSYMLHDSTTRAQAARMFVNFLKAISENEK